MRTSQTRLVQTRRSFLLFPPPGCRHEPAARDTCGPVGPALQKGMRLLWEHGVARPVLQVLEGGIPASAAETDPG